MTSLIAAQVAAVRSEIRTACQRVGRDPAEVRLIAVTKSQGPEVLPALAAAGITAVGENRLDHQQVMHQAAPQELAFHAIGRLQSRQLAKLLPLSRCFHGLCEADHLSKLARACADQDRRVEVFIQVNTSGEASKAGVTGEALPAILAHARTFSRLAVVGLMTMAPERDEGASESVIRSCFARCRDLAQAHGLARLSMGMSQDFPWAIAEGATDIRIGTRLFTAP
jgi:pyridoxal phosphate enzyme (YggS family)